jgi:hypothetical protein
MSDVDARRRKILAGGAAATALWVAPSVMTLDRVSAASGTCGTAPVQLDWSNQSNGTTPGTIVAADGTEVTFTLVTAKKPGSNNFKVRHITRGALNDMLYLEMSNGGDKDYIEIRIDFDTPVDLCFTLVDVDRREDGWEDTVEVLGTDGGTAVPLGSGDLFLYGTGVSYVGTNTVRGVYSVGSSSNAANVDVRFPAPVDSVVITYSDITKWTTGQFIGIHDLRWC